MSTTSGKAGVAADVREDEMTMSVEVAASPERVFRALASREITAWWVRPGVFDTREWTGDVRPGGRWRAGGMSWGQPYAVSGEFVQVDAPRRLVHTWDGMGPGGGASSLSYELEPLERGTRISFRQSGFVSAGARRNFAAGWETSFERLQEILEHEASA